MEVSDCIVYRMNGEVIPQMELTVPESVVRNIDWLLHHDNSLPCAGYIPQMEPVHITSWLGALLGERLERKTADIFRLLDQYAGDWNEVFYITLTQTIQSDTSTIWRTTAS